jgi:uncharacterized protein DUF732
LTSIQVRKPSRLLLLVVAGAAPMVGLLGPVGPAPTAHADDDAFLAALKAKNINYESPEAAINGGHLVCHELDLGATPEQVANDVINNGHLDAYHAGYFVGVSIRAFCPKYAAQS